MHAFKEIVNCLAGVVLLACVCSGMPNQNEKLIKTASFESPKLPESKEISDRTGEIPVHLIYGIPARVEEVDEDIFMNGRESQDHRVKRKIQRYQKLIRPKKDKGSIWSSLTNIIEYNDKKQTQKRDRRSTRKSKRDGLHVLRIKVRRGGVAIAGPGGVASAGTGGTAIVGPGGSAFTEADGTAIVGPGAKLYQLPSARSRARSDDKGYKLIATGPYIFHPQPRRIEPQAFF